MTFRFVLDLAVLLIAYALLAIAYTGLGWATCVLLKLDCGSGRPFILIWLGWSVSILVLDLLNIMLPISAGLSIGLLGTGMVLGIRFLVSGRGFLNWRSVPPLFVLAVVAAGCWIAALALRTPANYDAGLYYFNTIRWLNEYPVVLGLGNLHGRLAFNQTFFTYVAAVNLYPLFKHGHNVAASFLWLVLFAELLPRRWRLRVEKGTGGPPAMNSFVGVFFVPVLLYLAVNSSISSSSPDFASSLLQIYVFAVFARWMLRGVDGEKGPSPSAVVLIILATMVTIKLSNLAYSLSMAMIVLALELRRETELRWRISKAIRMAGLPALVLVVWAARGVMFSGCPVYPSTVGCIKADWSVPPDSASNMASWIYSWARNPAGTPNEVLGNWAWLGPWFERAAAATTEGVYPTALSIVEVLGALGVQGFARRRWSFQKMMWLIPVPAALGLLAWFAIAPDLRFAEGQFWILPVSTALLLLAPWIASREEIRRALIVIVFMVLNASVLWALAQNPRVLLPFSGPGFGPIPTARLVKQKTVHGLVVWTPREGDQCWDSQLPCTPYFDSTLDFVGRYPFPEFRLSSPADRAGK